ncbi:zinc finger protein 287-like [Eleginops maclovinus]|uniref:zinc finger protein 287-like n=1 Tax=Eleginops maclovinus TaxID=56733 RepID=UPI003080E641
METALIQLRLFVHQRLYRAAEDILGEVEKTIKLALLADGGTDLFEEDAGSPPPPLDLRKKPVVERSLTSSTVESEEDECDAPLQENPGPSTPEESNLDAEIPGPSTPEKSDFNAEIPGTSQKSADLDNNDWNYCSVQTDYELTEIKEEQEELWDDSQTEEMYLPSSVIVKSEQDLQEGEISYELEPVSDSSAAQSENSDRDEELVNNEGEQTNTNISEGQSEMPEEKNKAKSEKGRSFCHFCGKGFQYIGSLMKHIKTHENNFDCTACGMTCQSTQDLIVHVKDCHNETCFCEVCGKIFANMRCLRLHERIHGSISIKEYVCQECGKTFYRREHLIVHVRTHSGEKPYHCDVCGKAFSQSQNLTIHKRSHSGEKPYQCGLCGKLFNTSSHLKTHMRYHSGEKPYQCDVCGKRFGQSGQMTRHRTTHTGERPYGCHICGMRYRFAPNLKVHIETHEKATTE